MTNVIELQAFRQRTSKESAQAPQAAASRPRCPGGLLTTLCEAAFLPFTLWRGAAAFWLSIWMAPLGFQVEAIERQDRPPAVPQSKRRRGKASRFRPVRRHQSKLSFAAGAELRVVPEDGAS